MITDGFGHTAHTERNRHRKTQLLTFLKFIHLVKHLRRAWSIFWKTSLLSDLIVKGVRPWVIDAALECAATATKCFHSALQCVFRKLLKNIKMVVFIFSESELLITDWKIVSSNPYLSIFPSKIPLFLSKFLAGALWKYLVRLTLLLKFCNSSNQLGSKHYSLSQTHLVSSLVRT